MDNIKMQKIKVVIIVTILILGMAIGILLNIVNSKNALLFDVRAIFSDYIDTSNASHTPYDCLGLGRSYFPFAYVLLNILNFTNVFGVNLLIIYVITFFLVIYLLLWFFNKFFKDIKGSNLLTLILIFFAYPLWFVFNRGNIEYLVFAFLIIFFVLYKNKKYNLAAIVLAFPVCIKLYPAIFAILFLKNKKYKPFFIATFTSILLMLLSYIILGGNFAKINTLIENFSFFTKNYSLNIRGIPFGHSIWNLINYIGVDFKNSSSFFLNSFNMGLYTKGILFTSILLFLYTIFIEKKDWKVITILTIMMVSFPYVSFDYTLINLYIPLTFFVISDSTKKWESIFYSIAFSLILIPMNWTVFADKFNIINIGVFIRPLLMIVIIITIIISNYYERKQRSKNINEETIVKV